MEEMLTKQVKKTSAKSALIDALQADLLKVDLKRVTAQSKMTEIKNKLAETVKKAELLRPF